MYGRGCEGAGLRPEGGVVSAWGRVLCLVGGAVCGGGCEVAGSLSCCQAVVVLSVHRSPSSLHALARQSVFSVASVAWVVWRGVVARVLVVGGVACVGVWACWCVCGTWCV